MIDVLAQTMTPAGIPEWLWIVLAGVAGFFVSQVWPTLRKGLEARAERETAEAKADLEHLIAAQTTTANALEKMSTALDMMARDQVAKTFELQELRRDVRALLSALYSAGIVPQRRSDDTPAELKRLLKEEPHP